MIHLYTGNGKGKTTASLGLALRAVGDKKRVLMLQFIKGPWVSGEDRSQVLLNTTAETGKSNISAGAAMDSFANSPRFKIIKGGKGFVGILGDKLPREEHEKAAQETLERAREEIQSNNWDIVILDEVNNAVELNLISKTAVLDLIKSLPKNNKTTTETRSNTSTAVPITIDLILTGRNAPQEFIDAADLVTEMKDIKHPFYEGEKAKKGLEF